MATTARCEALTEERDALAARNERLRHLLDKLQRMQFGRRSERSLKDQLQFAFEEVEASLAGYEAEKGSPELHKTDTARRRAGRGRLPAHLPRIERVLMPKTFGKTILGPASDPLLLLTPVESNVIKPSVKKF